MLATQTLRPIKLFLSTTLQHQNAPCQGHQKPCTGMVEMAQVLAHPTDGSGRETNLHITSYQHHSPFGFNWPVEPCSNQHEHVQLLWDLNRTDYRHHFRPATAAPAPFSLLWSQQALCFRHLPFAKWRMGSLKEVVKMRKPTSELEVGNTTTHGSDMMNQRNWQNIKESRTPTGLEDEILHKP